MQKCVRLSKFKSTDKWFVRSLKEWFWQEEVTDLLLEAMAKHPESKGFLVDGFPASVEQAKICEDKLGKPE